MGNPLQSRPSKALAVTILLITFIVCILPFSPLRYLLGCTPLPGPFFLFLGVSTLTYPLLVEIAKRLLFASSEV